MSNYNNLTYYPSNYNRLFADKGFVSQLVTNVQNKLGRQLLRTEKTHAINILKNINPVTFKGKSYGVIINVLVSHITEELAKTPCNKEDDVNIHEMLKTEIGISTEDKNVSYSFTDQITSSFSNQVDIISILGNKTLTDLQRIINPGLVETYAYIMLDTRYRLLDNDGTTSFQWNFINNEIVQQGTVNAIGNIRDIIAMRIMPLRLPYAPIADNSYNRVSLFIQEFSAQSFIAQENTRFHFMFHSRIEDRWINLQSENYNDGYYRFRNPITRLETITISFGAPLQPIVFDTDRMNATITTYGASTIFTTASAHNLETGDLVYISNFSTANNATDNNIVSAINRDTGHIIVWEDDYSFSIDVNSTSIITNGAGTIDVVNGSATILGTGTTFTTFFMAGDIIEILSVKYTVLAVANNASMTVTTTYTGATANGVIYRRNNILTNLQVPLYFGSKRIFIPLELKYYASGDTLQS